jgi:hypothetical protein
MKIKFLLSIVACLFFSLNVKASGVDSLSNSLKHALGIYYIEDASLGIGYRYYFSPVFSSELGVGGFDKSATRGLQIDLGVQYSPIRRDKFNFFIYQKTSLEKGKTLVPYFPYHSYGKGIYFQAGVGAEYILFKHIIIGSSIGYLNGIEYRRTTENSWDRLQSIHSHRKIPLGFYIIYQF